MQIKEKNIAGKNLRLETGRIARQSNGAVLVTYGETTVLATVNAAKEARNNPSVDNSEKNQTLPKGWSDDEYYIFFLRDYLVRTTKN